MGNQSSVIVRNEEAIDQVQPQRTSKPVCLSGDSVDILKLPDSRDSEKFAKIIHGLFSKEECNELIKRTELAGYTPALVNVGHGREVLISDYRNSLRHISDDFELSSEIFKRVRNHLPEIFKGRRLIGLNERLRFLKYRSGDFFIAHKDGNYRRKNEMTLITIQLYLNEDAVGGFTRFLNPNEEGPDLDVVPEVGMVLLFQHDIVHEGALVTDGVKYVMRSDIFYTDEVVDDNI